MQSGAVARWIQVAIILATSHSNVTYKSTGLSVDKVGEKVGAYHQTVFSAYLSLGPPVLPKNMKNPCIHDTKSEKSAIT